MHISFILSSLWLSGGVRVIVEYANGLADRQHQITLVIPKGTFDADVGGELHETVRIVESQVKRSEQMNPLQQLHLSWSMAQAVPPSDFVFSTHTPTTVPGFLSTRLLRKGRPIWLYQDYLEMFIGRPIEQCLLRNAIRWHDSTFVISNYAQKELSSYAPGNIVVVGEGISHKEEFQPKFFSERPTDGTQNILCLGDMRPRKGLVDFLHAVELVYVRRPNIKLWIVSKEPCQFETAVPYEFIYRPSRSELAKLYADCHLFVLASWWESLGLPPLEAMACAAPMVLVDSGGVMDYAVHDENCLVVPKQAPNKLAEAMITVLDDSNLAQHLSQNGPPTADRYEWEAAVERFATALNELV